MGRHPGCDESAPTGGTVPRQPMAGTGATLVGRLRPTVSRLARHGIALALRLLPPPIRSRGIPLLRFAHQFQISATAMQTVRERLKAGGNLLVFGAGLDSATWELVNRKGRTVFLEDVPEWIERSRAQAPQRAIYRVAYATSVEAATHYSDVAQIPLPALPIGVQSRRWDVVVVDGPMGWKPEHPGRAASITLARRLAAPGGLVLVDDYERPTERDLCFLVFGRAADAVIDPKRPVGLYRC